MWHGNAVPKGYWWDKAASEIPNIYFVSWEPPQEIYNKKLTKIFFASDVLRLQIIALHGGIYIDTDILALQSFDAIRQHDLVLGNELQNALTNRVIIAKPWSIFLRMMLDFYHSFDHKIWAKTSMNDPNKLNLLYPQFVHKESNLISPAWPDVKKLYEGTFDWSKNYCVHVLGEERFGHLLPNNTKQLDGANYTLGAIMRQIYYGDPKLRGP